MQLIFERGDRDAPVGHALIYFRSDDTILATYISVPPISFDISKYVPGFMANMMQGMDLGLGDQIVATPLPPIPEEVSSYDHLVALAERRKDDLVFAGGAYRGDPMRLAAETAEAAREYGELYSAAAPIEPEVAASRAASADAARYAEMSEGEKLNELTTLVGRLRDAVGRGQTDPEVEGQLQALAGSLPPKYRPHDVIESAHVFGDRGQKLAELYLERCYKLFHEDYLDLERIDREIEAL
jgi:hypothetical protein